MVGIGTGNAGVHVRGANPTARVAGQAGSVCGEKEPAFAFPARPGNAGFTVCGARGQAGSVFGGQVVRLALLAGVVQVAVEAVAEPAVVDLAGRIAKVAIRAAIPAGLGVIP